MLPYDEKLMDKVNDAVGSFFQRPEIKKAMITFLTPPKRDWFSLKRDK